MDPVGPLDHGAKRVMRGGSWSGHARFVRASVRFVYDPAFPLHALGLRCARVQEQESAEPSAGQGSARERRPARRKAK